MSVKQLLNVYLQSHDPSDIFIELQGGSSEKQAYLLQDPFILSILLKCATDRVQGTFKTLKSISKTLEDKLEPYQFTLIGFSLLNRRLPDEQNIEVLDYLSDFGDLGRDAIVVGLQQLGSTNRQANYLGLLMIRNNIDSIDSNIKNDVKLCMQAVIQRSSQFGEEAQAKAMEIISLINQ